MTISIDQGLQGQIPCGTSTNLRLSKDLSVTSVGATVCHHSLIHRNGAIDLQKGEWWVACPPSSCSHTDLVRFISMDYVFLSTVKDKKVKMIKISYDIACCWSIKLFQRIESYSLELHIPKDQFSLKYFIPKFYLPAHRLSCYTRYSLNYCSGMERTYGENIKSSWAHTTLATVTMRVIGASAQHSALNSHWGVGISKRLPSLVRSDLDMITYDVFTNIFW